MSDAPVGVAGVGMTRFATEHDDGLIALASRAAHRALADADLDVDAVTSLHVGNMLGSVHNEQAGLANALSGALDAGEVAADTVENTSASGASAVLRAVESVMSGRSEVALVVGAERMSGEMADVTEAISRLTHRREYAQGVTLPSFGGLAADAYLRRYDADRAALAEVAAKNHRNARRNPYAQFRTAVDTSDVLDSPPIAEPLRLYDCCPMTDGAAALVVTADDRTVRIGGIASATDTHAVAERTDPLEIRSVRVSGERAFARSGLDSGAVDVACIHDAFTILEWLELEELGFYEPGTAWRGTVDGETARDGALPVNPGGGLKARGHPLGATGVSQLIELVWQLRGEAGDRQVADPRVGFAVNVAGFGNNAVCTVLEAAG